jgi:hypothetical protein
MNRLKFLFKKKEPVEVQELNLPENISTDIPKETGRICDSCGTPIYEGESWTKPRNIGRIYHRKCWREMEKMAWQG